MRAASSSLTSSSVASSDDAPEEHCDDVAHAGVQNQGADVDRQRDAQNVHEDLYRRGRVGRIDAHGLHPQRQQTSYEDAAEHDHAKAGRDGRRLGGRNSKDRRSEQSRHAQDAAEEHGHLGLRPEEG
eukprot:CAMPEP_0197466914 /NCGR_PEP_ID=MMETSP1175-20131217/65301_1 /TAXON_ID=1003142 /ORGANISM="Triceratium dubium, Strain CCMP147" /LENGTH=126 /DNA_ID=CAMNT_0043002971 /DNA_START=377 /DNA_END=753 /DNA_ORIENTATION=-